MNINLQGRRNFHPARFGSMADAQKFVVAYVADPDHYNPDDITPQDPSKTHSITEDESFVNYVKTLNFIMEDVSRSDAERQTASQEYDYLVNLQRGPSEERLLTARGAEAQAKIFKQDEATIYSLAMQADAANAPPTKSSALPLLAVAAAAYFMFK